MLWMCGLPGYYVTPDRPALPDNAKGFIIGVQWHPEYMPYAKAQRKLCAAFSASVKASNKTMLASMNR